jgi:hypothetical protein
VAYAAFGDVNGYLDGVKLVVDSSSASPHLTTAEDIVRGYLSAFVATATLDAWDTPNNTPRIIRDITGMWAAGAYYQKKYFEDETGDATRTYGAQLQQRAEQMLMDILQGKMVIEEDLTVQAFESLESDDFTPNDATSAVLGGERKFGMGTEF